MAINKIMEIDTVLEYRVHKKLIKIKIKGCEIESNDFESLKVDLDPESLHPYYIPRLSGAPEYLSKEDKSKISIQIEKFLVSQRNNLEVVEKTPGFQKNNSSAERNKSDKLTRIKEKRNGRQKTFLCSPTCIIG